MAGMTVLERTTFSASAGNNGAETTIVSNIDVSDFAELQVMARLHAFSAQAGAMIQLRLRASAATDEDPAQTFRPSTPELACVTFLAGSPWASAPQLALSDVLSGFGTNVDLTMQLTPAAQGTSSASVSVDFSLHAERAPRVVGVMALLSSSSFFTGPASSGPSWSLTGGTCAIVFRKIVAGNLTREYRTRRWTAATSGWRGYVYDGTNARLLVGQARPTDLSETNTVTLGQNVFHRAVLTNNAGTLECYLDGVLCSAGTALGGSYVAPTTQSLVIEGSAAVVDEIEIASISVSDTGMNAAQVAWWDRLVKAGGSRRVPNAGTHLEAEDWTGGAASWIDRVYSMPLAVSGTPVVRRIPAASVVWA